MSLLLGLYVVAVLIGAPLVAWAGSAALPSLPRARLYRAGLASSWMLALIGAAVLWWDGRLRPADVGLVALPPARFVGLSVATTLALLAAAGLIGALLRAAGRGESAGLRHLVPRDPAERRLFILFAITAGITEEFIYRGVALAALMRMPLFSGVAGPWAAAIVVALAFGLGHGYQRPDGMARAALLGLVLAAPVLVGGSLLPGMIAHATLDLSLLLPAARRALGLEEPA